MRAVTCRRYGPPEVLRLEDIPPPTMGPRDVRVRVHATTVTSGDARVRGLRAPAIFWLPLRLALGVWRPRHPVPGMEFSGVVDSVGAEVTGFAPGQAVFGATLHGANAEWLVLPADAALAPRPPGLSDIEAAALPFGALTALVFLRDVAKLRPGEHVLVVGAAGCVGAAAVQIARHLGARVTGLCSADATDLVRSLGAGQVLDRSAEGPLAGGPYDVILDTPGALPFARARAALARTGRHVVLSFGLAGMVQALLTRLRPGPRVMCGMSGESAADLHLVAEMVRAGVLRPVIGRVFPLEQVVAAHHLVDRGPKRGSVVLTVPPADPSQGV